MRIGVDVRPLLESAWAGVATYVDRLTRSLVALGSEHEYLLFSNALTKHSAAAAAVATEHPGVHYRHFRVPNKLLSAGVTLLHQPAFDRLLGGVDVFLSTNLGFSAFSSACPIVAVAHDLSFESSPDTYSWRRRRWHQAVRSAEHFRHATRVIAVSESTRRDLITQYGVPEDRIVVIHPGLDRSRFSDGDPAAAQTLFARYQLTAPYILSLGTQEPRKNVDSLIRAFRTVESAIPHTLVIAGASGWSVGQGSVEPGPRVRFLGYVPESLKPALYQGADLFVYPTRYEGFGFPPLEAAASSTPVIAGNHSSLVETVGSAALLVDPYNVAELARAVRAVITDRSLRDRLVTRGRDAAARFRWSDTARQVLGVLEEAAGSG